MKGRQKICLITTGPGKTLGDAALCEKLAANLLEKYDVEIDVRLYLIDDAQKDAVLRTFQHLKTKYPDQINITTKSGNLYLEHDDFDPSRYDKIIPFAAYNLFDRDFLFTSQFFVKKPNIAFIKTKNASKVVKSNFFKKNYQRFNKNDKPFFSFIQEGDEPNAKFFVHYKNETGKDIILNIDKKTANVLIPYFNSLNKNTFYCFDKKDDVKADHFDVTKAKSSKGRILKSKRAGTDPQAKASYYNTAYNLQSLVKELSLSCFQKNCEDKTVYLTRYDYFSDDYLKNLAPNDLELLGLNKDEKNNYGEMFLNGQIKNIQAGFGQHKHGILLPKVPEEIILDTKETVKANVKTEDQGVIDLLYGNQSKQEYEHNHELFFGYHNIIPNTDISALPIKNYVKLCLDINEKNPKKIGANVDFILNIHPDNGDVSNTCKISEVIQGIDLNKYDVEFWKKNNENNQFDKSTVGNCDGTKPIIRIINPFGINHDSFLTLLRISNDLTLQTGNSSILEAFYLGKVPLYQLTSWSTDFLEALEKYTSDKLGANSYYATFFRTANDRNMTQEEKIEIMSDIYRNHFQEMKKELTELNHLFKNEMDLNKNLPKLLKEKHHFKLNKITTEPHNKVMVKKMDPTTQNKSRKGGHFNKYFTRMKRYIKREKSNDRNMADQNFLNGAIKEFQVLLEKREKMINQADTIKEQVRILANEIDKLTQKLKETDQNPHHAKKPRGMINAMKKPIELEKSLKETQMQTLLKDVTRYQQANELLETKFDSLKKNVANLTRNKKKSIKQQATNIQKIFLGLEGSKTAKGIRRDTR